MEGFGILEAVAFAEFAVAGEDEFLDVVAVGGGIVVAEQGEFEIAFGEFGAEAGTVCAGRPFGDVGAVGFHLFIDDAGDVDDAGDFGAAGEVILVGDGVGLESGNELFGVVVGAAGHPASGFDGAGGHVMIGVFFVVGPGIPADDGVGLEGSDEEDEAAEEFIEGGAAHLMVAVVEIELVFEAEDRDEFGVVILVAEDVIADGAWGAESGGVAHVVVGGTDEVAGVSLFDEFGDGAGGTEGDIVGVRLDGEEDFAAMGHAGVGAFDDGLVLLGADDLGGERARDEFAEQIAA